MEQGVEMLKLLTVAKLGAGVLEVEVQVVAVGDQVEDADYKAL